MSIRNIGFEHYNEAKKALSKGNSVCQHAEELATETQTSLSKVATLLGQIGFLRSAIYDQLQLLRTVATQVNAEESRLKVDFAMTIKDLDVRDHELNVVLGTLKNTRLPVQLEPSASHNALETGLVKSKSSRTLFDFAHDEAVESLKGQLRQSIDDMQEVQENMMRCRQSFNKSLEALEKAWLEMPSAPALAQKRVLNDRSTQGRQESSSISAITQSYTKAQEEHIGEMAKLLLQLTEHYDHCSKLFQLNSTMPLEEIEELRSIVDNDAQQVDDVLLELDDRVLDMEDDVSQVNSHIAEFTNTQMRLLRTFKCFEDLDVDSLKNSMTQSENDRATIHNALHIWREQLTGLADHYIAFSRSYDALILEISRRAAYESTVEKLFKQTEESLARLAEDESLKRQNFIHSHGNSLPEDIWHGIRERPTAHKIIVEEPIRTTPRLPEELVATIKARLSRAQT